MEGSFIIVSAILGWNKLRQTEHKLDKGNLEEVTTCVGSRTGDLVIDENNVMHTTAHIYTYNTVNVLKKHVQ